jgi:DNA replication protein DnaC
MMNSQTISSPETVSVTCPTHGEYQAKQWQPFPNVGPITSGCPQCAKERQEREQAEAAREAERRQRDRIAAGIRSSGIPARYIGCTLDGYETTNDGQRRALALVRRYVEAFPSRGASLVLCGKPGTGKTHLACAVARLLIERGHSAVFDTVVAAIRGIKDTYRKDSQRSESQAIDDLLRPELLVIDEVGAQLGTDHEKLLLFEIINERYQACRSTILISNLTREELGAYLGDRVMDRFHESGAVVAFDWASHRGVRP